MFFLGEQSPHADKGPTYWVFRALCALVYVATDVEHAFQRHLAKGIQLGLLRGLVARVQDKLHYAGRIL